jgi:membrane-bound inhibitor of C-type lysozyme
METYDQTSRHETSATSGQPAGRSRVRRLLSNKKGRWVTAGLLGPVIGLSAYGGTSSSVAATTPSTAAAHGARSGFGGGGSNARSGPAAGGSIGKVSSVSTSGFGLLTSAGEKVTVKETSSTRYEKGKKSASASAVTKGKTALVLGTTDSTTITATQVIVQPTNSGSKTSSKVIPFKRGAASTAKKVGQIPANYKQGSGTIVSGTTANKATKAALAAYAGGIVDRVVRLSNGEYEVHYIGVNWPHHIFVKKDFKVVGAF